MEWVVCSNLKARFNDFLNKIVCFFKNNLFRKHSLDCHFFEKFEARLFQRKVWALWKLFKNFFWISGVRYERKDWSSLVRLSRVRIWIKQNSVQKPYRVSFINLKNMLNIFWIFYKQPPIFEETLSRRDLYLNKKICKKQILNGKMNIEVL